MINTLFMTPWKNVWVDYIKKYFDNKPDINVDFNISYTINLHELHKYDSIVFCWCDSAFIKLTKQPFKYASRYIVFIRSYEIFFGYVEKVNWKMVDDVIFVNKRFYEEYKPRIEKLGCRVHYLPNAIDLDAWPQQEHKKSFDVAMVANLSHKKGIDLIPQFMHKLVNKDSRYFLHIAGRGDEKRHTIYVEHLMSEMGLSNHYKMYGKVDNVQEWLRDKDYLFTCSVTEGHPNNVIEAMTLGIKPIIHSWIGARDNFPGELIWTNLDRAVELVTEENYNSNSYRQWSEEYFDMNKIYPNLEEIVCLR